MLGGAHKIFTDVTMKELKRKGMVVGGAQYKISDIAARTFEKEEPVSEGVEKKITDRELKSLNIFGTVNQSVEDEFSKALCSKVPKEVRFEIANYYPKLEFSEKDMESEASFWNLYERFRSHFHIYRRPRELRTRFNVFKRKVGNVKAEFDEYKALGNDRGPYALNYFTDTIKSDYGVRPRYIGERDKLLKRLQRSLSS